MNDRSVTFLLGNYDRPIDQPTDRPTNSRTLVSYTSNNNVVFLTGFRVTLFIINKFYNNFKTGTRFFLKFEI